MAKGGGGGGRSGRAGGGGGDSEYRSPASLLKMTESQLVAYHRQVYSRDVRNRAQQVELQRVADALFIKRNPSHPQATIARAALRGPVSQYLPWVR